MTIEISEKSLKVLQHVIVTNTGILFDENHQSDLIRHISSACRTIGLPPETCLDRMGDTGFCRAFIETLVQFITIGETYFFRDKNIFTFLRDSVLPELIRNRRKEGKLFLRLWSAACSSGEEPYSLALLIRHLIPDISDWNIYILGTDINHELLKRAKEGIYSRWSFRDEPLVPIGKYITPTPDNRMKVEDSIKGMVRFERVNLIHDSSLFRSITPSSLDLIMCRNVLMYFDPDKASDVVSTLVSSLNMNGILIVSPQEIGIVSHPQIQMIHHESVFIHIKGRIQAKERIEHNFDASPQDHFKTGQYRKKSENILFDEEEPVIPVEDSAKSPLHDTIPEPKATNTQLSDPFDSYLAENHLDAASDLLSVRTETLEHAELLRKMELLIRAYAGCGRYDMAAGWSERMIASDPLNPKAYLLKAAVLEEQGLSDQSIHVLRQSLYADPDYLPAHLAMAGVYTKLGRKEKARHYYELATDILEKMDDGEIIEESEGIPAGKMKMMIRMLLGGTA